MSPGRDQAKSRPSPDSDGWSGEHLPAPQKKGGGDPCRTPTLWPRALGNIHGGGGDERKPAPPDVVVVVVVVAFHRLVFITHNASALSRGALRCGCCFSLTLETADFGCDYDA